MMKFLLKLTLPLIFFVVVGAGSIQSAPPIDPFQWEFDGETRVVQEGETISLEISFRIPPRHYLYKAKIGLTLFPDSGGRLELGPIEFSPSITKKDPFLGKVVEIFEGGAVLKSSLRPKGTNQGAGGGEHLVKLELTYQGCSDSLCYRLMRRELLLPLRFEGTIGASSPDTAKGVIPVYDRWLVVALLLSFLGGLGSAFTPCVLPLIPITLAFIGVRREGKGVGRNFILSLFLVLSMALTYAVIGLLAAIFGKGLGFLFQNIWFLLFSVVLYVVFALSLLGLFEFQLPLGLRNAMSKMGGQGVWGAIIAGATMGFLAAPCLGPLIASLLLYVAERQDLSRGFALLFFYGLGLGSIFLVVGTFYHQLASKVHGGPYMVWIKRLFAVILLIPAFYYGSIAWSHLKKERIPQATEVTFWNLNADQAFIKAKEEARPLFVDFFATWCLPCLEMEARTFSDDRVQQLLVHQFVPLKIDCTQETPQCRKMVERYSVIGWPTFLILKPTGEVIETIVGKSLSVAEMIEVLRSASGGSPKY